VGYNVDMDDAWSALTRYKLLVEKVNELKKEVWRELPAEVDAVTSLQDAEEELGKLRAWIEINYEVKRWD